MKPTKPQRKAKTTARDTSPRATILVLLRDRIYAHLLGCERGDFGLLENVPHATLAELAQVFGLRETTVRREVNRLVAAGGAGVLGDTIFPLPGYAMRPAIAKPPRKTTARTSRMKTRKIAGHAMTLAEGVRYVAMRPMGPPPNKPVTVSIHELPYSIGDLPALQITVPDRNEADKLLRRFNGRHSLDGRVW